ncbi:MAG: hypothetical protein ACYDC8_05845 [Gammaproteobacteria bacterium]
MRIALLEDAVQQAKLMRVWLAAAAHDCRLFHAGPPLLEVLRHDNYDLTSPFERRADGDDCVVK